jgi:hypothetical protein
MARYSLWPSFRDALLGAGPESILPVGVMDSGLARKMLPPRPGMTLLAGGTSLNITNKDRS